MKFWVVRRESLSKKTITAISDKNCFSLRETMATQTSTDDGLYKREYRRIKSLVSSAYVRQTSVSFNVCVFFPLKFEESTERAWRSHMCPKLLCHGCDLLSLDANSLYRRKATKMQHIERS